MTPSASEGFDDLLGPAGNRFFGSTYRQVIRSLGGVTESVAQGSQLQSVTGLLSLTYPDQWSRKVEEVAALPHLSSIDAVIGAASLLEAHLCSDRLNVDLATDTLRLTSVEVKAGSQPLQGISAVPMTGWFPRTEVTTAGTLAVTYLVDLSGFRVRFEFGAARSDTGAHPGPCENVTSTDGRLADLPVVSTPLPALRFDQITADIGAGTASCRVPPSLYEDVRRGISVVDAVIVVAQLVQTILYANSPEERARSHNLWMRSIKIDVSAGTRAPQDSCLAEARLLRSQVVRLPGSGRWRTARFSARCGETYRGLTRVGYLLAADDSATNPEPQLAVAA
jgi:hypothetical protein